MKKLLLIKELLDEKYQQYNTQGFIENDPVLIPHLFSTKEDIEIAGFLAATIAWGNRKSIITNARQLMTLMEHAPHEFIVQHSKKERQRFKKFVHRTFNGEDLMFFMASLQNIYLHHGGLEQTFSVNTAEQDANVKENIIKFRCIFFGIDHPARTLKHVSNPEQKSSAKRLCMFLRWMVRKDKKGVDFGIWTSVKPSQLCLPLDVHTGNISRNLGILKRKQNDWQAVEEVTAVLQKFDPLDPVKYDFSLFGMGVNKDLDLVTRKTK